MEQNFTNDIEFQNIKKNLLNCDVYRLLKKYFNVVENKVNISINIESTTTKNDINLLEKIAKIKMPKELIQLYLLYDKDDFGTFLGFDMIDRKDLINEFNEDKIFNQCPELLRSIIPNTIKNMDTNSKWIPFARDDQGTYFAIDLDPDVNGKIGQIIAYGTEQDEKLVYADSFCEFLSLMCEYAKNNELFIGNVFDKQMVFVKDNDLFHYIYDNNEEKRNQILEYKQRKKQIKKENILEFIRKNNPEFKFLDEIRTNEKLSDAFYSFADYRIIDFISDYDRPIFPLDEANYNYSVFLIGKDGSGNDYVLLNSKKVGFIDHEGYCYIIANSIKEFLSLIALFPYWVLSDLITFSHFKNSIEKFKSENVNSAQKKLIDSFIEKNNFETDINKIYESTLKAIITEPPLIIKDIMKWKNIFKETTEEIIIDSGWSEETMNMLRSAYKNIINGENITKDADFDFNFKLVIIDNLLYNTKPKLFPSFEKEYQNILTSNTYKNEFNEIINKCGSDDYCSSLYEYLKNLKITQEDLDKIESLYFDGGSQIYVDLAPNWDGESELFDVKNIDGIQQLKNLKKVNVFSMTNKTVEEELKKSKYEVWIDDGENSVHIYDNIAYSEKIVNSTNHSKLNKNINSFIDIISDDFKYKLGTIFDDKLKKQLIIDGFRDDKSFDFGLKQEYYTNDKLYLSFNTESFEENANLILDSIIILNNNKDNSFLNIKIGDYNINAKSILNDNNYKEVVNEIENIKKYLNVENSILVELWLEESKIYKIVVGKITIDEILEYKFINNSLETTKSNSVATSETKEKKSDYISSTYTLSSKFLEKIITTINKIDGYAISENKLLYNNKIDSELIFKLANLYNELIEKLVTSNEYNKITMFYKIKNNNSINNSTFVNYNDFCKALEQNDNYSSVFLEMFCEINNTKIAMNENKFIGDKMILKIVLPDTIELIFLNQKNNNHLLETNNNVQFLLGKPINSQTNKIKLFNLGDIYINLGVIEKIDILHNMYIETDNKVDEEEISIKIIEIFNKIKDNIEKLNNYITYNLFKYLKEMEYDIWNDSIFNKNINFTLIPENYISLSNNEKNNIFYSLEVNESNAYTIIQNEMPFLNFVCKCSDVRLDIDRNIIRITLNWTPNDVNYIISFDDNLKKFEFDVD